MITSLSACLTDLMIVLKVSLNSASDIALSLAACVMASILMYAYF